MAFTDQESSLDACMRCTLCSPDEEPHWHRLIANLAAHRAGGEKLMQYEVAAFCWHGLSTVSRFHPGSSCWLFTAAEPRPFFVPCCYQMGTDINGAANDTLTLVKCGETSPLRTAFVTLQTCQAASTSLRAHCFEPRYFAVISDQWASPDVVFSWAEAG